MYQIIAQVTRTDEDGYWSTASLPTFYLNSQVQGITSPDHAVKIVQKMLNPFDDESLTVSVSAAAMSEVSS